MRIFECAKVLRYNMKRVCLPRIRTLLDIKVKTCDDKYAEAAPEPNSVVEYSQQTYFRRVRQEDAHLTHTTQLCTFE